MKIHFFDTTFQEQVRKNSNETNMMHDMTPACFRQKLATFAENPCFQRGISVLIIVNTVTLGGTTRRPWKSSRHYGPPIQLPETSECINHD